MFSRHNSGSEVQILIQVIRRPATKKYDAELELTLVDVLCEAEKGHEQDDRSTVAWVKDDISNLGLEDLLFPDFPEGVPKVPKGHVLRVTGAPWISGPDYDGDYDGGFELATIDTIPDPSINRV